MNSQICNLNSRVRTYLEGVVKPCPVTGFVDQSPTQTVLSGLAPRNSRVKKHNTIKFGSSSEVHWEGRDTEQTRSLFIVKSKFR